MIETRWLRQRFPPFLLVIFFTLLGVSACLNQRISVEVVETTTGTQYILRGLALWPRTTLPSSKKTGNRRRKRVVLHTRRRGYRAARRARYDYWSFCEDGGYFPGARLLCSRANVHRGGRGRRGGRGWSQEQRRRRSEKTEAT